MSDLVKWALTYHSYGMSKHAKKWYRVARVAYVDNGWFELYWHEDQTLRGENKTELRKLAKLRGLDLAPGVFCAARPPKRGSELERTL